MKEVLEHFGNSEIPDKLICRVCEKILNSKRVYNLKSHLTNIHKIEINKKTRLKSKVTKKLKLIN